ncbi:MAG: hypothetical protein IKD37_04655 [Clostridia bacterium]|nr:hypothetical protein [Clostridia bacterium]
MKKLLSLLLAFLMLFTAVACSQGNPADDDTTDTADITDATNDNLPFKVLYSNDFTNITSVISPYHKKYQAFTPEMLEASIAEVEGYADVHLLQMGGGRVPLWQSDIYSMADHRDWWCEYFGVSPDHYIWTTGVNKYLLEGGDVLADFVDACHNHNQLAFVSLRLNDQHALDNAMIEKKGQTQGTEFISRFYVEHLEYRISQTKNDRNNRVLDWKHEEVRSTMLALIAEQCENYDIDGVELDFQRHPSFFDINATPSTERIEIMSNFIAEVRAILDRTTPEGEYRYLSVRVPAYLLLINHCGLDLTRFDELGVDLCVSSDHYFSSLDTEFPAIVERLGEVPAFFEMTHTTYTGNDVATKASPLSDVFNYRRTTPEQFRTLANVAYHQGAAGVSFFNMAYYREYGDISRGPFHEPPFAVMRECGDPAVVAAAAQDYLLAPGWACWSFDPIGRVGQQMPRPLRDGMTETFTINLYPQDKVESPVAILRLQVEAPLEGQTFTVTWNGEPLTPSNDIEEPFGVQYPSLLGNAQTLRAFALPLSAILDGENTITVTMQGKPKVSLIAINVSIP